MKLISIYTASRLLELTPPTVYRLVREGILEAHRDAITGRLYVEREQVERLIPKRRVAKIGRNELRERRGGDNNSAKVKKTTV